MIDIDVPRFHVDHCPTPDVIVSYKRLPDTPFVFKEKSLAYVRARKRKWREDHGLRARGYTG